MRRAGEDVFTHYAGTAQPAREVQADTLFPIASITKCFTAAMLMRLVEMGELTVNLYVSQILPRFTGEGREEIRLRHLLTHTSGLPYESSQMEEYLKAHASRTMLIEEAYTASLLFSAGTRFSYGDYNYLLAGCMAEAVTGKAYADLVHELVIEPMGLRNTFVVPPESTYDRLAVVRGAMAEGTDGSMYNSVHARGLAHPAFSVCASLEDMLTFLSHFVPNGPRIHKEVTVRAMTRPQTGDVPGIHPSIGGYGVDARIPWGLGFALQNEQVPTLFSEMASFQTFGHGGASGCQIIADPASNLIVVALTNTHARTGRPQWYRRLQSIINMAFAEFG